MGRIDDPTSGEFEKLKARVAQLESRSPLSDSAVSGGRTRFIGENSFLIEGSGGVTGTLTIDGLEVVDGELRVTGSMNVSGPTRITGKTTIAGDTSITGDTDVTGTFNLDGPANIDGTTTISGRLRITGDTSLEGAFHVTGATVIDGKLTINGDTGINGDTTLSGDLTADDSGRIKVGDMTIGRSGGRGKVDFGTGELASDGTKVAIQSGPALAGVGGGIAQLTVGGNGFRVDSGGIRIGDLPVSNQPPNLYLDDNNKLWRTTATSGGGVDA